MRRQEARQPQPERREAKAPRQYAQETLRLLYANPQVAPSTRELTELGRMLDEFSFFWDALYPDVSSRPLTVKVDVRLVYNDDDLYDLLDTTDPEMQTLLEQITDPATVDWRRKFDYKLTPEYQALLNVSRYDAYAEVVQNRCGDVGKELFFSGRHGMLAEMLPSDEDRTLALEACRFLEQYLPELARDESSAQQPVQFDLDTLIMAARVIYREVQSAEIIARTQEQITQIASTYTEQRVQRRQEVIREARGTASRFGVIAREASLAAVLVARSVITPTQQPVHIPRSSYESVYNPDVMPIDEAPRDSIITYDKIHKKHVRRADKLAQVAKQGATAALTAAIVVAGSSTGAQASETVWPSVGQDIFGTPGLILDAGGSSMLDLGEIVQAAQGSESYVVETGELSVPTEQPARKTVDPLEPGKIVGNTIYGYEVPQTIGSDIFYSQHDKHWARDKYAYGEMTLWGCGPTVQAMAISQLTGKAYGEYTPDDAAKFNMKNHYYDKGGTLYKAIERDAARHRLEYYQQSLEDFHDTAHKVETLQQWFNTYGADNIRIIIGGHGPKDGDHPFVNQEGHVIVIRGVTDDGKILIMDPNRIDNNAKPWEPEQIFPYNKNAWQILIKS
jgi:hypothetical protein